MESVILGSHNMDDDLTDFTESLARLGILYCRNLCIYRLTELPAKFYYALGAECKRFSHRSDYG